MKLLNQSKQMILVALVLLAASSCGDKNEIMTIPFGEIPFKV